MDDARLQAAQEELMKHHCDYTNNQYLSHLALDVLPQILEKSLQTTVA